MKDLEFPENHAWTSNGLHQLAMPLLPYLTNGGNAQRCCRFVVEKNPEKGGKSGKVGAQTTESNETNMMEKTLNQ